MDTRIHLFYITSNASLKTVHEGNLCSPNCAPCHGINAVAGPVRDLLCEQRNPPGLRTLFWWEPSLGRMPSFKNIIHPEWVRTIHLCAARARESAKPGKANASPNDMNLLPREEKFFEYFHQQATYLPAVDPWRRALPLGMRTSSAAHQQSHRGTADTVTTRSIPA